MEFLTKLGRTLFFSTFAIIFLVIAGVILLFALFFGLASLTSFYEENKEKIHRAIIFGYFLLLLFNLHDSEALITWLIIGFVGFMIWFIQKGEEITKKRKKEKEKKK